MVVIFSEGRCPDTDATAASKKQGEYTLPARQVRLAYVVELQK